VFLRFFKIFNPFLKRFNQRKERFKSVDTNSFVIKMKILSSISRWINALEAGAGGYFIADGILPILDYISKVDSIRDGVYRTATKITPELIIQADDLVSRVNFESSSLIEIAVGVTLLGLSYGSFKQEETKKS